MAPLFDNNRATAMSIDQALLKALKQSQMGCSLSELLVKCPQLSKRTAQRWLQKLMQAGEIRAEGEGRARRYFVNAREGARQPLSSQVESIPLSPDSLDILSYVNKPLTQRQPVGYQSDFLCSYQPNKSYYLPLSIRRQLANMGSTSLEKKPAGTFGKAILNRLLIDLTWASSRLEGNTYSLLETQVLIEKGQEAQGKAAFETQMLLNHKSAIELLVEQAGLTEFNRFTIMTLHGLLSENLLVNPADEGRVRQHAVEISESVYRPLMLASQLTEMLEVILSKASEIVDPFEKSFFIMVHLPYLQPFADVNKRTSRLAANIPLLNNNLCPLTFLDVPEKVYIQAMLGVYELNRIELLRDLYLWAYERSVNEYMVVKQNLAEPDPLRLAYRNIIREAVAKVIKSPSQDVVSTVEGMLKSVPKNQAEALKALILEELRRLHEGTLARYGLTLAEFERWKNIRRQ